MSLADINRNLDKWYQEKRAGCEAVSVNVAAKTEKAAKMNAPWKDHTGHARQGLQGKAGWESQDVIKITLSHTVEYGPRLELDYDKKYAILEPTLSRWRGSFYRWVKHMMDK